MKTRRVLSLAILSAMVLSGGGCSVYDPSLLRGSLGGGSGGIAAEGGKEGGKAGGAHGGTDAGFRCGHAAIPAAPTPSRVLTAGGSVEFVTAMSTLDLGDVLGDADRSLSVSGAHYLDVGFDLDSICTRDRSDLKTGQECAIPSYGSGVLDGVDGQDNALGKIIQVAKKTIPSFGLGSYSQQIKTGGTNLILHVTGYNGEANDDQVTVEALVSAPFDSPPRIAGTAPAWDGNDAWPIASDSYDSDGKALYADPGAYVVDGKIVITLKDADLRLPVGAANIDAASLDLKLHGAFIVCDLLPTAVGHWLWTLKNCTLGARSVADDLVHQLAQFVDPSNGLPVCQSSPVYAPLKSDICGLVDVSTNPAATTCDGFSVGLTFDTEPAILGDQFQVVPPSEHCAVGARPSDDSCEGHLGSGGTDGGDGGKKEDAGPTDAGIRDASRGRDARADH